MFNCTCCGTEVTSPYFYGNGVYGWTCIKKVNPNAKRNKPKSKCVEVEVIKIQEFLENSSRSAVKVSIDGKKEIVPAYREYINGAFSDFIEIGNFKFFSGKWWALV